MEVAVSKNPLQGSGAKLLVKKYRETFRIPENINYYSKEKIFEVLFDHGDV
jgi:hypothetical protein